MIVLLVNFIFLFSSIQLSTQQDFVCNTPAPSQCDDSVEVRCDMGTYQGCWKGDYCMPEGSVCPPVCHHPAPSNCLDNEIRCDSGTDQGCWIGDYCMPKGSVCPDLFV